MNKTVLLGMLITLSGCANIFQIPQCYVEGISTFVQQQKKITPTSYLAETIYFADGSAKITHNETEKLMRVAKKVQAESAKVKILGHASTRTRKVSDKERHVINMNISNRRAFEVMRSLSSFGVKVEDIKMEACADFRLAEIEVDPKTEALNRRVEIFLYYE